MPLPLHELARTEAAVRIASHARASNLFFSHFEHHVDLEGPDAWQPDARPDLGARSGWRSGVLPEAKFRHFRIDRMVASFHPAHSPKWTAHELCHRLVGFAWRPDAPPLFVATAARLAELAPVALWYFYDEIGAARCPRHAACDPRFDLRCPACEALAERGPVPTHDADRLREEGDRYVAAELAAVAETRRLGRSVSHRWATLELASDGLAWAAAHGRRVGSPAFNGWIERFVPENTGQHATLDALTARVEAVIAALRDGAALSPWDADRRRWIAQDMGWRLTTIHADCEGEAAAGLDALLDAFASTLDVAAAVASYRALAEDFELPSPEDAFATGYALPDGLGRSTRQVTAGLATACPRALTLLGDAAAPVIAGFVAADTLRRAPLARRFAAHLAALPAEALGPEHRDVVELAALEATVVTAPPMDTSVATLRASPAPAGPVTRAPGVAVVHTHRDWRGWLGARGTRRPKVPAPETPLHLAIVREPDGGVALHDLDGTAAAVGDTPCMPTVPVEVREALLAAGVWALASSPVD
jgi:hypothetical protein